MDEACDHGAIESMGKDEQLLRDTVRNAPEQTVRCHKLTLLTELLALAYFCGMPTYAPILLWRLLVRARSL